MVTELTNKETLSFIKSNLQQQGGPNIEISFKNDVQADKSDFLYHQGINTTYTESRSLLVRNDPEQKEKKSDKETREVPHMTSQIT